MNLRQLFTTAEEIHKHRNQSMVNDKDLLIAALISLTDSVDGVNKALTDLKGQVQDQLETIDYSIARNTDATVNY